MLFVLWRSYALSATSSPIGNNPAIELLRLGLDAFAPTYAEPLNTVRGAGLASGWPPRTKYASPGVGCTA